jgi:hypothetical protein
MKSDHIAWCRNMFSMLAEGGMWAVPRSGLIFNRVGEELILATEMPWQADLSGTPQDWADFQADEFESIREHFGAAGITVKRKV